MDLVSCPSGMWLLSLLAACFGFFVPHGAPLEARILSYPRGIDAVSVRLEKKDGAARVRAKTEDGWTAWQRLSVEDEQDPSLLESNMVMFPRGTTQISLEGAIATVHPIRVSSEGPRYETASLVAMGTPRILTRDDWGADDSLLISKGASSSLSSSSSSSSTAAVVSDKEEGTESTREQECADAVKLYPEEFKASAPITRNENGDRLRWPLQYSPSVRLLVVHHTAGSVTDDGRTGIERMRAIYQFHAVSRGWGDIGYHYVIDEKGQIYEGRQGGDYVVGGHAYCNNVGTIGVSLMGNFDAEKPPQAQAQSLQWLLSTLADKYHVDLRRQVLFHGKKLDPIVGHRQLVNTSCPGAILYAALDEIRGHVRVGDTGATVAFADAPGKAAASSRSSKRPSTAKTADGDASRPPVGASGLQALGSTALEGRPSGEVLLSLLYAPKGPMKRGSKIASVKLSSPRLKLFQDRGGEYVQIRGAITAQETLSDKDSTTVRLKLQLPPDRATHTLIVGDIAYTIAASGKRIGRVTTPVTQSYFRDSIAKPIAPPRVPVSVSRSSSSRASSARSAESRPAAAGNMIRIRLTDESLASGKATLELPSGTLLNGEATKTALTLTADGSACVAVTADGRIADDLLRIDPGSSPIAISSFRAGHRRFRGTLECRVVGGALTLIDELPLEDYLAGLAEEPDTEPYEKQRAFAVAARTYAAYYLDAAHRKFPGMPYDGSDSPAEFQYYGGYDSETQNPSWVRAVETTRNLVLEANGAVLRAPYFSADDGRTRSPEEAGWKNFPNADVLRAKDDPWCRGQSLRGHGVGMSGCGAEGQAAEGKTAEQILEYYYPGTALTPFGSRSVTRN